MCIVYREWGGKIEKGTTLLVGIDYIARQQRVMDVIIKPCMRHAELQLIQAYSKGTIFNIVGSLKNTPRVESIQLHRITCKKIDIKEILKRVMMTILGN